MITRTLAAAVSLTLLAGGALAHHSLAGVYDIRGNGTLTGVVKEVRFTNPHGAMHVEVEKDGQKTEWILTTGSANTLANLGVRGGGANNVVAGDVVTITYFPARNGKPLGFIRSITLPNRTTLEFDPE